MRYYIIKPEDSKLDKKLMTGICAVDKEAAFSDTLKVCDIAVLQKDWTRSKSAVNEWKEAVGLGISVREGYFYNEFETKPADSE